MNDEDGSEIKKWRRKWRNDDEGRKYWSKYIYINDKVENLSKILKYVEENENIRRRIEVEFSISVDNRLFEEN